MSTRLCYGILLCLTTIFFACEAKDQENTATTDKKVESIKVEGGSISEIIRNPVTANEPIDTVNVAKMAFEEKRHHFGTVNEGDIVRHAFKFTNTGKVPLVINNVKSTCGCTVPDWPKDPVPPNGTGVISVRFDTKGKTGNQAKPVTILANTYPNKIVLQLKGEVIPAKK